MLYGSVAIMMVLHLLGVDVVDDYVLDGDRTIYFHHGHRYDKFLTEHPILTWFGDAIYWGLQKLDPSFGLARQAKSASKTFMRNHDIIKNKSIAYAKKYGYDAVCTGHSHFPIIEPGEVEYCNSGSWTELPCTFLTIDEQNNIQLHNYT